MNYQHHPAPPARRLIDPIPAGLRPSANFAKQRLLLAQKAGVFKGDMPDSPAMFAPMWRGISPGVTRAATAAGGGAHPIQWLQQQAQIRRRLPAEDFQPFPQAPVVDPGFEMAPPDPKTLLMGLIQATRDPNYSHQDALARRFTRGY